MTILCYHTVEPGWTSPLAVEPEAFARHASWLQRHRAVIPLHDAVNRLDRSGRLPRGYAALTFDDGFAGLYHHALPVLAEQRLPATVFLVAQTLNGKGQRVDWVDTPPAYELSTLQLDQIREMQAAGIAFESHSLSHADLTALSFEECVRDLRESRELLESVLGHAVRLLAYPRGRHDDTVQVAARRAGYTHAFTLPESRERPGPYAVPRVGVYRGNGTADLRVKAAHPYLWLRTSRAHALRQRSRATRRAVSAWLS